MQSKKIAGAGQPADALPSPASLHVAPQPGAAGSACRRAARRLEIDRDHRLVSKGLLRELSRLLMEEPGADPEVLMERIEAALAASRADYHRLNNARINLRGERGAPFADSVCLPAALAVYGHRGNYHGAHASMAALGLILGPLVELPFGEAGRNTAAALADTLHRRCEIWTLEQGGAVHVFARPGSAADKTLAGSARRVDRASARTRLVEIIIV
jgi:hypothetical protein